MLMKKKIDTAMEQMLYLNLRAAGAVAAPCTINPL